jgi:hypothetical protein
MTDADGHLYTSFVRPYTDDRTGQACPSHIADFFVYRDRFAGQDKLFALSSDPSQRGFKFYVGVISRDGITIEPELTQFSRSVRNVTEHHDAIVAAYCAWLTQQSPGVENE